MSDTPTTISKTEAREIRSLVKNEYSFLDTEIGGQATRIKSDIRQQLEAAEEAAIQGARKKIDAVRKKAKKLEEEGHELLRELQSEGFVMKGSTNYRKVAIVEATVNDELEVSTIQKRMKAAFDAVDLQVSDARRGFKLDENEATRKLTLNMVDSDEAREFINNIPTLDALIAMPNLKELTA